MKKKFIAAIVAMMTLVAAVPCFASPSKQSAIEVEHITPQTMRENRDGVGVPSIFGYYTVIKVRF